MNQAESLAFSRLFQSACALCFGRVLETPLSEPESRHLSHEIEEKTGLVLGWKSLKNYSMFVLDPSVVKRENPSTATLDTLARYCAGAPVTTEAQRQKNEAHYGYWFRYQEAFVGTSTAPQGFKWRIGWSVVAWVLVATTVLVLKIWPQKQVLYRENFQQHDEIYLQQKGWLLLSKNEAYWQRRHESFDFLTLFTLPGDNWYGKTQAPRIQNLLVHPIENECFNTEIHLTDFVPSENWQQAGLLLLEDTAYQGKSLRLSLAFNDYFGGYTRPGEILIQGVASFGAHSPNVEEVQHHPLFSTQESAAIVHNNLHYTALRIEKRGQHLRFLYAASPLEDFSFKELGTYDFDFLPRYVGIFALKGFVDSAETKPVKVRFFMLENMKCR